MVAARTFRRIWLPALLVACTLWLITVMAPAQAAQAAEPHIHVVQEYETLSAIANRYGTTVEAIIAMNALPHPDVVRAGQRLLIPEETRQPEQVSPTPSHPVATPPPAIVHVVQAGETLSNIARRYGTTVEQIVRLNAIPNADLITVGQRLRLPLDMAIMGAEKLPAGPLEGISITPWPAMQGQTVTIVVTTSRPVSLSVMFNGSQTPFVLEGYRQWALLGIHAMAKPGLYPLHLHATMPLTSTLIEKEPISRWGEIFDLTLRLYVVAGEFPTYDLVIPASSEKAALLDSQLIRAEQAIINQIFTTRSAGRQWEGRFSYPLAAEARRVTSVFGERRSYNGGPATSYHEGIDFGAPEGTPVYAPAAGTVVLAEPLKVRGNALILDHGYGVFTGYWHLSELNVHVGERVRAGDLIARVGSTGLSTGSHLHWELRVGGVAVDPAQWVHQPIP